MGSSSHLMELLHEVGSSMEGDNDGRMGHHAGDFGPDDRPVTQGRQPRSDMLRTRDRLLDTAGEILRERGTAFTLPDLARESGVSTATTYRHFDDVHAVFDAYYRRTMGDLAAALAAVAADTEGMTAFDAISLEWVTRAVRWGRAATHIRSASGYLERVREGGDPIIKSIAGTLSSVVKDLVALRLIPPVDPEYAELIWITLFDERVIVDLAATLGWETQRIADSLGRTVLQAWGGNSKA